MPQTKPGSDIRRAMRLSVIEGLIFSIMVGTGELYFLADAVRLGASHLQQALVLSLPLCLGALGPWIALAATTRIKRKRVVFMGAAAQALTLAALVVAERTRALSPNILIALVCVYQLCGQGAGTAWSAWIGDLVPASLRGRYFARRNRVVHVGSLMSLMAGGALLHVLEPGAAGTVAAGAGGTGYAIIFAIAALARGISAAVLAASPDPDLRRQHLDKATTTPLPPEASGIVRRILLTAALVQLTVYVASPYFGPFMLDHLRLSYAEYTLGSVAVVAAKFLALRGWGSAIDRHGARNVYLLAVILLALIPIPWLWARGIVMVFVAQSLSGFAWGGYEVGYFSLLLDSTTSAVRLRIFAAMTTVNGLAQVAGSLLGGALLAVGPPGRAAFLWVFAASAACRLCVGLIAPMLIPARSGWTGVPRGRMLLRVLGMRAGGGIDHRPMAVDDKPDT